MASISHRAVTYNASPSAASEGSQSGGGGSTQLGVVFNSDFGTATGKTANALTDGGEWTQFSTNGTANTVVAAASEGIDASWPTTNALKVIAHDATADGSASSQILRITDLPVPDVGESLYYRWYISVLLSDALVTAGVDTETHPIQDGAAIGNCNWAFQILTNADGTWNASLEVDNPGAANPVGIRYFGRTIDFDKETVYRFELRVHRISAAQFNLHMRVYNAADELLYDDADWIAANGTTTLADNPAINFLNVDNLNGLNAGFNGLGGTEVAEGAEIPLYYQGAFAVSDTDWLGAYAGGI